MQLYLVRHAESVLNAARVVQPPDTPLSERGRAQADQLGARLAAASVGRIRTSHLPRAVATAEAIARHCGAPVDVDPDLQERNYGAIRGTPYAELHEDIFGPDYVPPLGESWVAFHARVDRAWEHVLGAARDVTDGSLVVVTHGLVCWSILSRHVVTSADTSTSMRFANTSITIVDGPPWHARLVDCTAHLGPPTRGDGERA